MFSKADQYIFLPSSYSKRLSCSTHPRSTPLWERARAAKFVSATHPPLFKAWGLEMQNSGFGTKLGHTAVEYPWPYQKSWFCSQKNHQFEELRIWSHTNKYFARAVVPNFWLMSKQNQKTSQVPVCSANKVTSIHPLAQKNPKTTQISRFVLKIGRNTITNNNTIADYCKWLQENSSQQQGYSPSKKKRLGIAGIIRHHWHLSLSICRLG